MLSVSVRIRGDVPNERNIMSITKSSKDFYNKYEGLRVQDVLEDVALVIPSKLATPKNKAREDVIGREVAPGDLVGISRGNDLTVALLVGFTPEGFRVMPFQYNWQSKKTGLLYNYVYSEPRVILVHKNLNASVAG